MFKIKVRQNTNIPLREVDVGRASAFECEIVGVPDDYQNVQIAFQQSDGASVACACNAKPGGVWGCYASGAYFLSEMANGVYHITAKTAKGDSAYLGCGTLRVVASVLNVDPGTVPVLPQDCYVRGSNGLYYKVTAALDEDGVPYMIVDSEGITK